MQLLHCQMLVGGAAFAISLPLASCIVPQINGPVAIFLTTDAQPLAANPAAQLAQIILAGPALAFIDTNPQTLGQLVRGGAFVQSSQVISAADAASLQSASINNQIPPAVVAPQVVASPFVGNTGVVPVSGVNNVAAVASLQVPGGPNFATGLSSDGQTNVLGWSNVPSNFAPPSAAVVPV